jgi:hypothetical protein
MQQVAVPEGKPLSQVERVVDTFVAPSKTFQDILRSTSWWLPWLMFVVLTIIGGYTIGSKVGFDAVAQRQVELNPAQQDQISQLPPEDRAKRMHISAVITEYVTYGFGVMLLLGCAFMALLYWASFNFGLGAKTTFGQMFAVNMYALLPRVFISILNIALLFAGVNTENYDIRNPVGTNLAYYMPDASPALKQLLSSIDIFSLWSLALTIIGTSIVARKSKGQAAAIVLGWWILFILIGTGFTAATS